jgi:hypothetical protein
MKKAIVIFVVFCTVLYVIFFMRSDDKQILGDEYYYLPRYEAIDVGFPGGAIIYKGIQKYHFQEVKVKGEVLDVDYDDNFIVAVRLPVNSLRVQEPQLDEDDFDSLQFYIIEKKSDLIHGPYTEQEYIQRRGALGVPEKLKLNLDNLIP